VGALERYLVDSTQALRSCTFAFADPIKNRPDYYLRWMMKIDFKRDPTNGVDEVIGMSHIRFNREGKVVFHQDYWDPADLLYRRIPVAN